MSKATDIIQRICTRSNPRIGSGTWVCDKCGEPCKTDEIKHKALLGRHLGHPDDDSEDDFLDICPGCRATDSMVELSVAEVLAEEDAREVLMDRRRPHDCGPRVSRGILHKDKAR